MVSNETSDRWTDLLEDFDKIQYPQWGAALAWRCFARSLPGLFRSLDSADAFRAAATVLRAVLAYPFVLDVAYRDYRKGSSPAALQRVAVHFERLLKEAESVLGRIEIGDGYRPTQMLFEMLRRGGHASTPAARRMVVLLRTTIETGIDQDWMEALRLDLDSLEPLDSEGIDDLKLHLERPLWPIRDNKPVDSLMRNVERIDNSAARSDSVEFALLWSALRRHMASTMDWAHLCAVLLRGEQRELAAHSVSSIRALANDRRAIAILLARVAFSDRDRLDLVVAPTAQRFRETVKAYDRDRTDLAAWERELRQEQTGFIPHATWLAWVQVVHRNGIDAICAELGSWVPRDAGAARAAAIPIAAAVSVSSSAVAKVAVRRRSAPTTTSKKSAPPRKKKPPIKKK